MWRAKVLRFPFGTKINIVAKAEESKTATGSVYAWSSKTATTLFKWRRSHRMRGRHAPPAASLTTKGICISPDLPCPTHAWEERQMHWGGISAKRLTQ